MFKISFKQKSWKHRSKLTPLLFLFFSFFLYWLFIHQIKICGPAEEKPGPKRYSAQYLTIFHWNLNSIEAHNFVKVALLNPTSPSMKWTSVDDDNLQILGYSSLRADQPSNTKRGRVLMYYKNFLPIEIINVKYLHKSLNFELRIRGKICKLLPLYKSPSQNKDGSQTFLENLELNFDHMAAKNLS